MTDSTDSQPHSDAEAHRLVGKFLQRFALMEQAIDVGIGKLLKIEGGTNYIVCSSIPFAKKLGMFFSSEGLLGKIPEREQSTELKNVRSSILELNNKRVMFAHLPFSQNEEGVSFRRVVAE